MRKEKVAERIFEEIMAKTFSILMRNINLTSKYNKHQVGLT